MINLVGSLTICASQLPMCVTLVAPIVYQMGISAIPRVTF